jgi:hypothetical protein
MSVREKSRFLFVAAALAAAVSALVATVTLPRADATRASVLRVEEGRPAALARHMERLQQTIPGDGGEPGEGPGGAEDYAFLQRAYPDTDVPLANIEAARAAYAAMTGRGFPQGKGRPGTWVTVGPSYALYPATQFRSSFSYVPAAYAAAGRTTALAISPNCRQGDCALFAGPAGGGIWRTKNALDGTPNWEYLSGPFGINTIGSIAIDPNDSTGNTVWVGTGESNSSADSGAGVGLYKSSDGGATWNGPLGTAAFNARSVGSIALVPGQANVIYAASTRGGRGISAVNGGTITLVPGAPAWGLYKSSDGGNTWTLIHNGSTLASDCTNPTTVASGTTPCSLRGVRRVGVDPVEPNTVYAGSYGRGVWRSSDAGATWTQINASLQSTNANMRPEFAVNVLPNGKTRMYIAEGASGSPTARLFRSDDVRSGSPTFTMLTSSSVSDAGFGSYNYCSGQCWYDNFVVTPAGHPDIVYLGGSYQYGETGRVSNGRAVVLSTDAGASFTDMTMDATDSLHPNGLHPDEHFLVTNPNNPLQFFESGDGGIMRSSGQLADASSWCGTRGLSGATLARCQQLLSAVPSELQSMNKGLTSLQFQSVSVSPFNVNVLQGGTQDNGTWQSTGNPVKWLNTMIGDGGQSGFDIGEPNFRFHTFYDASPDVNFSGGDMADWNWIADPIYGTGGAFYIPIITDPLVSKTMFAGTANVVRTKTWGMGTMSVAEFRSHCNEWFGDFTVQCGDWVPIASPSLTAAARGTRSGGSVVQVRRTKADTSTLWAATTAGRVFISKNADAEPQSAVAWTRIDTTSQPNRFVSGIYVDPADGNHAWVSYSGYNGTTPSTPGHVFEVTYDQGSATATWVDRSADIGDMPITDVARDDTTGDLYASSDFGVFRLASGSSSWSLAAPGMPKVEVTALTIVPGARKLYAATHGLGAWLLNLQ